MIVNKKLKFAQITLVKLLKTLSKEELLRFGKFLKSPFFNYTPSLIRFYQSLKRYHPSYDSPRLDVEKLWVKAFPDKKFDEQKFRQLCSDLSRMVEQYLVQLELERPEGKSQHLLIQSLGRRNEHGLFQKKTIKLQEDLEKQPYKDAAYFLDLANLQYNFYAHVKTDKYGITPQKVETIMSNFDSYYFAIKLQFGCELNIREKYFQEQHSNKLLEEIKGICQSGTLKTNSLIQIYLLLHKLNEKEFDDEVFEKARVLFQSKIGEIRLAERSGVFLYLLNYSVRKINGGDGSFNKVALDLYKIGLAHNLAMVENQMPESVFTNIVSFGCYEKEFDWTQQFIDHYEQFLDTEVRHDSKILSLVLLHFWRKDYEEVSDLIANHKFSLSVHEIKARTYLLRAWLEIFLIDDSWFEFLFNKIKTFDQFVRRNKTLAINRKEGYLNFAKVMTQFIVLKNRNSRDKEEWSRFMDFIKKQNRLIAKNWFLEKLK